MSQNHAIGSISIDCLASRQSDGFALQKEVSEWFWRELVPELNAVLDEVVSPDTVLRLDRISISLPLSGNVNWKEKLTASVCRMVVEEITRRRFFPNPSDAPVAEMSPAENSFDVWLNFLSTGRVNGPAAVTFEWETLVLDHIATSSFAASALLQTFRTQPAAIERLVRQYDQAFLLRLAGAVTGTSGRELMQWQSAFRALFTSAWWRVLAPKGPRSAGEPGVVFWKLIFERLAAGIAPATLGQLTAASDFFYMLIERMTGRPVDKAGLVFLIIRFLHREGYLPLPGRIAKRGANREPEILFDKIKLREAVRKSLKNIPDAYRLENLLENAVSEQWAAAEALLRSQGSGTEMDFGKTESVGELATDGSESEYEIQDFADELPDYDTAGVVAEGTVFYVQNAGVVLLYPFLTKLFTQLGLKSGRKSHRRRAVQLIHYIATGDIKTPEYDLLLPKILTGWPIDLPIDGSIRLSSAETVEINELLETVISHWQALGSTSIEGLREGFFCREGRLSKNDGGWTLKIESKTIDILLNSLPWGIGVVKNDWMSDYLYVEWY